MNRDNDMGLRESGTDDDEESNRMETDEKDKMKVG